MNTYKKETDDRSSMFKLADVYYILFRHKWKIVALSAVGFVAALVFFFTSVPDYASTAKLFVKYVADSRPSVEGTSGDSIQKTSIPANVLASENEILTSLDLAAEVADAVGPEKILGQTGPKATRMAAATMLARGLYVDVPRNSSVMRISYYHRSPEMAQVVLRQIVLSYLRKHAEIHRPLGINDEFLSQQTDTLRGKLTQLDEDIRKLKLKGNIVDIDSSKKTIAEQISKIKAELFLTETELSDYRGVQKGVEKVLPTGGTNTVSSTNAAPSSELATRYRSLLGRLVSLRNTEQERVSKYTDENPLVKSIRDQIAQAETSLKQLQDESPSLAALTALPERSAGTGAEAVPIGNRVASLEARQRVLAAQLENVRKEAAVIEETEASMGYLLRAKAFAQSQYDTFVKITEQERVAGIGKITNITPVQEASPAYADPAKLWKTMSVIIGFGLFGGVGLAFLIEMLLDQTIRRPGHLENKFGLPLFLTIPEFARHAKTRALLPVGDGSGTNDGSMEAPSPVETEPWAPTHPLRSYSEALRDRLVMYFQKRNMTHKPKLIGITSCSRGAGVTSIAAGLAATLSETGDGNVLLVDLNLSQGASLHPFFKGKLACGLSDVLELEKRTTGFVKDNLYAATVNDANGMRRVMLPKEFSNFVPKLKASDYDYIIFDMPPVNQISPTPRLAAMLDVVHLVIESEGTQMEAVRQAKVLLTDSNVGVAFILNKIHNYLPRWMAQES